MRTRAQDMKDAADVKAVFPGGSCLVDTEMDELIAQAWSMRSAPKQPPRSPHLTPWRCRCFEITAKAHKVEISSLGVQPISELLGSAVWEEQTSKTDDTWWVVASVLNERKNKQTVKLVFEHSPQGKWKGRALFAVTVGCCLSLCCALMLLCFGFLERAARCGWRRGWVRSVFAATPSGARGGLGFGCSYAR